MERRINLRPEGRKAISDKVIVQLVQRRIDAWIRAITFQEREKNNETNK